MRKPRRTTFTFTESPQIWSTPSVDIRVVVDPAEEKEVQFFAVANSQSPATFAAEVSLQTVQKLFHNKSLFRQRLVFHC